MTQIIDSASLHPKTVKPMFVKVSVRPNRSSKATHLKVDRRVWEAAYKLADGEARRLVIQSETCVLVRN